MAHCRWFTMNPVSSAAETTVVVNRIAIRRLNFVLRRCREVEVTTAPVMSSDTAAPGTPPLDKYANAIGRPANIGRDITEPRAARTTIWRYLEIPVIQSGEMKT